MVGLDILENNIGDINIFENINSIKSEIPISKVIIFFERYDIHISKTTIQNLLRNDVISPLINGRYYGKLHILQIYFFVYYKEVYALKQIGMLNDRVSREDDLDNVFCTFYEINKDLSFEDYSCSESMYNIIKNMTSSVVYKQTSISLLEN